MRRAHKLLAAVAPTHRLWYWQGFDCFIDNLGQQINGKATRTRAACYETLAFGITDFFKLLKRQAIFLGKGAQRRRGLTGRIQGDVGIRTEHLVGLRRLLGLHGFNQYRQTPW